MSEPARKFLRRHGVKTVAIIVLAVVFLGNQGFRRLVSHTFQLRSLRGEVMALRKEENELQRELDAARRDDRALESAARKELDYLKPGEIEYRFPPPKRGQS